MKCENCNTNHKGEYGSGRFCSLKCARGFSTKQKRKQTSEKVSNTIKKKFIKFCTICGREVNGRKTCSSKCLFELKSKNGKISGKVGGKIGGKISALSQQRRSKNEIYFADLCKAKFKNVETNIQIFNGWDADVIIHDIKVAILWNGKWHYEKITKKTFFKSGSNKR